MSTGTWLWNEIHGLFDTDDGSLPEVRIDFVDTRATATGYALLRKVANSISPKSACFCLIPSDEERLIDSVSNPAALVVLGQAHPFHVVLVGIQSREVTVPDIGVLVYTDQLVLDYQMGSEWGAAQAEAFFGLLSQLLALDSKASLSLEDGVLPEVVARFHSALRRFSTNAA